MRNSDTFILVIDADPLVRRALARTAGRTAPVVALPDIVEARAALTGERPCAALIVSVSGPDCNESEGLEAIADAAAAILITTANCTPSLVTLAFRMRAQLLCKPMSPRDVDVFVSDAIVRYRLDEASQTAQNALARALGRLRAPHTLTSSEEAILNSAVRGLRREDVIRTRDITVNTYKTHVKSLLRKLHASSIGEVRERLLREARLGEAPGFSMASREIATGKDSSSRR